MFFFFSVKMLLSVIWKEWLYPEGRKKEFFFSCLLLFSSPLYIFISLGGGCSFFSSPGILFVFFTLRLCELAAEYCSVFFFFFFQFNQPYVVHSSWWCYHLFFLFLPILLLVTICVCLFVCLMRSPLYCESSFDSKTTTTTTKKKKRRCLWSELLTCIEKTLYNP